MKMTAQQKIIDIALQERSITGFRNSINVIEKALNINNDTAIKKYSKSEINDIKNQLKKSFPHCKITLEGNKIFIGYSVSIGYCDWYEKDEYSYFGAEHLLIWNKNQSKVV